MPRIAVGVVLVIVGTVWILQGLNVAFAPDSFMTADRTWSWIGTGAVFVGGGVVWWGIRTRSRGGDVSD